MELEIKEFTGSRKPQQIYREISGLMLSLLRPLQKSDYTFHELILGILCAEIFGAGKASERAATEVTVAMTTPPAPKRASRTS